MSWMKMRVPSGGQGESLPGNRGRYLLWLDPPEVEGVGHYVHFSWKDESFCIRDYVQRMERRQARGVAATDIWRAASDRIPAKGELYVPVENFEFWIAKLTELSENREKGRPSGLWSRLSSKFVPKVKAVEVRVGDDEREGEFDVLRSFIALWKAGAGFDVVMRTVGCSARSAGEPLLWVFPTYFQIAPQGKGNAHHREVKDLRDHHFPEFGAHGNIRFDSPDFTWDRFCAFIAEVRRLIPKGRR